MISVEFMLLFLFSLGAVALIGGGMLAYGSAVSENLAEVGLTVSAEESARAAEAVSRCGIYLDGFEARIEESLIVDSGNRVVEIRGVFIDDDAEPL